MEKRSPKLSLRNEKVQSSCIWGLVDIFDFRNGRSNQKLLTNGSSVHKNVLDLEHPRKVQTIANCNENSQGFGDEAGLAMHDAGACEEDVHNLMQEEFATLRQSNKQKKASKQQHKNSDFELVNYLQDDHKKQSKPSKKADQVPILQWKDKFLLGQEQSTSSAEISLDKHNIERMFEEVCSQIQQARICRGDIQKIINPAKYNQLDQVNVQLLQITAKSFIDQIYMNRKHYQKDGVSGKSKHFSDASEILNLNMDLFLKLLQDPNSLLLKNIQDLKFPLREKERMNLYLDSKPSESGSSGTRNLQDPVHAMKIRKKNSNNHLWKKLKDRYGCSAEGNTTSQALNKIVNLKSESKCKQNPENVSCHCSSLQSHQSLRNKGQNNKSTYFSFKDIKRKFKQAVGENQKKQQCISLEESLKKLARNKQFLKDVDKGIISGSSRGKSVLSPDSKKTEKQQKLVDLTSCYISKTAPSDEAVRKQTNSSTSSCSKQRQLDIFMEAKRHLSERLRNVDVGETVSRKEAPRTLKMILSSPEQDFLATNSPKGDKSASVSAQMRFSPYNNFQMISTNSLQNEKQKETDFPIPLKHTEEISSCADFRISDDQLEISAFTPKISEKLHTNLEVLEDICSIKDDLEPNGSANILKANELVLPRSLNILQVTYDSNRDDNASRRQSTETTERHGHNRYMESSDLTIPSENHPVRSLLGPSRSLNICEQEIVGSAKYKEEHASPVSVLEPFSPEDVSSPTCIMTKPDDSPLQPRCIDFDEYSRVVSPEGPKINMSAWMDGEESLHLCVRAVMEASGLSFNDIYQKGPSPQDLLYTCVVDRVGLYPVESYTELQLLFDCVHEVLLGVYECYFGCPPWLSFLRQKIRSAPQEKDVVGEVVKEVNFYLLPTMRQPTLDQLIGKDIAKSGSWLDLSLDTEDILIQISEEVLQDSIEDTILEVQI